MVKETEYDSNYFQNIIEQVEFDLENLTEFNFKIVKNCFKKINTFFNINPKGFYKQAFEKLEELNSMKLINNNCSTTLFVFGRFYEFIADMIDYNTENNDNQKIYLVSINKALSKYGKAGLDRAKDLLDKHKSNLKDITDTSYKLVLDK